MTAALSREGAGRPRIGQGVDVHPFVVHPVDVRGQDRGLVLGGVVIPGGPPLEGHSDADVVCHAVTDAVLGAAALGDIGSLVGVDRPETAGADSTAILRLACERAAQAGFVVGNVDLTVLAQRPRIAPYVPAMRQRLSEVLGVTVGDVSVKATTTDGLGFLGRGEGIACTAVVLLMGPAAGA